MHIVKNSEEEQIRQTNIKKVKRTGYTLLIISVTPLIVYPFVILANMMSLVGHKNSDDSFIDNLPMYFFLLLTTLYPVTVIKSFSLFRKYIHLQPTFFPYVHLALIYITYILLGP